MSESKSDEFNAAHLEFSAWMESAMAGLGFMNSKMTTVSRPLGEDAPDRLIGRVVESGRHGIILVCRQRAARWPERLLYRTRGKIVGLIGSNRRRSRMLVPVDMSLATLLALMFLRQAYVGRMDVELTFVHVLGGVPEPVEQRWREVKKVVGLEDDVPLRFIPSTGNIAADLLETIEREQFGTVVMGKRGLSMIKRWLLGSVSAGVLRGLTDQTLFLID